MVSVCVCVFLFSLQAKLAQYDAASASVTPVKAAKLWDGEHRLQLPPPAEWTGLALLILPLLLVVSLPMAIRRQHAAVQDLIPRLPLLMAQASLFFRPPPAQ